MSGIECQRELRMVELREQLGQLGHAAAGMNAGRHVLDTDDHTGPPRVLGQLPKPARQRLTALSALLRRWTSRRDGPPGICPPLPPANPRKPSGRRSIRDGWTGRSLPGRLAGPESFVRPSSRGHYESTAHDRPLVGGPMPDRASGSTRGRISRTDAPIRRARFSSSSSSISGYP